MKKITDILISVVVIFVFSSSLSWAQRAKVVLKNGGCLYADVCYEEKNFVLLEIKGGTIEFQKDEIASIVYNPKPEIKKKNVIVIDGEDTYFLGSGTEDGWDGLISETAEKYQLDPFLVKAIMKVESNFDPYSVSRKGATGLMQLMPQTALECGVDDIFDPRENIEGGARFLRYLLDIFENDFSLALAGYNAGPNCVKKYKGIPPYKETKNYIKKVLYNYSRYSEE